MKKMKKRKISLLVSLMVIISMFAAPLGTLASASTTGSKLLKNVKVSGATEDGGTFTGMLTITEFAYSETEGLVTSGSLRGQVTDLNGKKTQVNESFTNVASTLTESNGVQAQELQAAQEGCQILFLDIGPIFLNLLGLELDIAPIVIDLTAVPGPGNLLGNLLCGVAGLLDGGGFLTGLLDNLLGLLDQVNDLLN
jgi:hypothetical protein